MIDNVKNIIKERIQLHDEDSINIEKCWNKLIDILSQNSVQTISILEQLDEEEILYVSEVFEEIAYNLQSEEYIECLKQLVEKYPNIPISDSVETAESFL